MAKKTEVTTWIVGCEGHTDAIVNAGDWPLATKAAAEFWGVSWKGVASRCICKRKFRTLRGVCPRCGRFFSGGEELCDLCRTAAEAEEKNLRRRLKLAYLSGKLV